MVSFKFLVVMVVFCILLEELDAQRNQTRPNRRNRNRNRANRARGRSNRNRAGGGRGAGRQRGRLPPQCEEIQVPMCKGLIGYTHTKLPNKFNHTSQLQVYRVLEHLWSHIDTGCSENFRLLACSLYLPKCLRRGPGRLPCRKTCKITQRVCESRLQNLGYSWPADFDCMSLPKRKCLKHGPHNSCNPQYTQCKNISLPMCQNIGFQTGVSPNMFGQCNSTRIAMEMAQFQPLLNSGCSADLGFFLCGVYMPFCTHTEVVMAFPCQEVCQQVRSDCEPTYRNLTGNLPWPNKFQCHRYPSAANSNFTCVMPGEAATFTLP